MVIYLHQLQQKYAYLTSSWQNNYCRRWFWSILKSSGKLDITDTSTLGGDVTVGNGYSGTGSTISSNGNISMKGALITGGNATIGGNTSLSGTLNTVGNATIGGTLESGAITSTSTISGTNITANGSFSSHSASITNNVDIGGYWCYWTTTLINDLSGSNAAFSGTLNVTGDTTVNNLIVNGTSTASAMSISGGSVDGFAIGENTPAAGSFTDLAAARLVSSIDANSKTQILVCDSGFIDNTSIGATTASTASVTPWYVWYCNIIRITRSRYGFK